MRRFVIDCRGVRTFAGFVAAMNAGLIHHIGGHWNGNLDAFNDYLSWPDEEEYELELLGASPCHAALGHAAYAAWLRSVVQTCHPDNVARVEQKLVQAEHGEGETLFDSFLEIFADNPHVRLIQS
jgi:hypothetical protein